MTERDLISPFLPKSKDLASFFCADIAQSVRLLEFVALQQEIRVKSPVKIHSVAKMLRNYEYQNMLSVCFWLSYRKTDAVHKLFLIVNKRFVMG